MSDDEVTIYHDGANPNNFADVVAVDDGIVQYLRRKEETIMGRRWDEEQSRRLTALWGTSMTQSEIAKRLGFSCSYISVQAEALGLPPRSMTTSAQEQAYLLKEANKRNLTPRVLGEMILATVARARLVDAVLDDGLSEVKEDADAL